MMTTQDKLLFNRLDTAATIFPYVSSESNSNVFRFSAKLVNKINPELLLKALENAVEECPSFRVKLKKGLFWYYFESNNEPVFVKAEKNYPCQPINKYLNNGYLFRVTYLENKVNMEIFHALCDGSGAGRFFLSLIMNYLSLLDNEILDERKQSKENFLKKELDENGYYFHSFRADGKESISESKAYVINGGRYKNSKMGIIGGRMGTEEVIALAKASGVTITAYFAALIIWSIYNTNYKYEIKNKPIVISIPVNLRKYYPSNTMRNFFMAVNVGINFYSYDYTFDEVVEEVSNQIKEKTQKEYLIAKVKKNVKIQNHKILKLLPLPIKKIGLVIAYKLGERAHTCTLSNIGEIKIPTKASKLVEKVEVMMSASKSRVIKCSMCSYKGTLSFTFATTIYETDIETFFFRFLSSKGIDVNIIANEV